MFQAAAAAAVMLPIIVMICSDGDGTAHN